MNLKAFSMFVACVAVFGIAGFAEASIQLPAHFYLPAMPLKVVGNPYEETDKLMKTYKCPKLDPCKVGNDYMELFDQIRRTVNCPPQPQRCESEEAATVDGTTPYPLAPFFETSWEGYTLLLCPYLKTDFGDQAYIKKHEDVLRRIGCPMPPPPKTPVAPPRYGPQEPLKTVDVTSTAAPTTTTTAAVNITANSTSNATAYATSNATANATSNDTVNATSNATSNATANATSNNTDDATSYACANVTTDGVGADGTSTVAAPATVDGTSTVAASAANETDYVVVTPVAPAVANETDDIATASATDNETDNVANASAMDNETDMVREPKAAALEGTPRRIRDTNMYRKSDAIRMPTDLLNAFTDWIGIT